VPPSILHFIEHHWFTDLCVYLSSDHNSRSGTLLYLREAYGNKLVINERIILKNVLQETEISLGPMK
jgi:hypothetical protein